ncbi:MAG: lytic transglycosylase domain-containing protein [archaeon]
MTSKKFSDIIKYAVLSGILTAGSFYNLPRADAEEIKKEFYSTRSELVKKINNDWIYSLILKQMSQKENYPRYISPSLVRAIVKVESNDNIHLMSSAGARGLLQIMPCVWREVNGNLNGYEKVFSPETNIKTGLDYFQWLDNALKIYNKKWNKLSEKEKTKHFLASYNGGIGRYLKNSFDLSKMPKETQFYVPKVLKEKEKLEDLIG